MSQTLHLNLERAWLNHVRGEEHFPRDMLILNKDMHGRRYKACMHAIISPSLSLPLLKATYI